MADCKTVFLSEIGDIVTGNTPKTSDEENYASNDIPFLKPSDFCNDSIDLENIEFFISEKARNKARILPVGSIAVTCIGIIGKTKVIHDECAFNQQINAIIPYGDNYNRYIAYAIAFQKELLQLQANSAVVPIINKTDFSKISIPLPSLETQHKIAANLDKVTHTIDLCNAILEKLDLLVKSRFVEMFGEPIDNPLGWNKLSLEEMCSSIVDCPHSTPNYTDEDTGYMCIRTSIVKKKAILWDNIEYISEEEYLHRIKRKKPQKGDIIYTREGAILGIAAIIDRECNVALGQRSMLLSPDLSKFLPEFICNAMNFDSFFDRVTQGTSGSASPHINVADIRAFSIIAPPLELQQQFAAFVEQTDKSKSAVKKLLEKAETLKKALMQEYFE